MKFQKVVWYEGMKLDPHHFQQADRFNQYNLNSKLALLNPGLWGIKSMQADPAALSGGSFAFVQCSGIMPDGFGFNMPENDPLPRSRNFEDLFEATAEKLDIFLALPLENISGNNCQLDGTSYPNSRFNLQTIDMTDYNTGTNMRSVGIAKPNFQFKFGDEALEDFTSIKIGELARSSDGKYTMDTNYIPPSLSVSNSAALQDSVRKLLGALISKSKELRNQTAVQKPELSLTHVEILLMLQTINSFIPLLNYYYQSQNTHPENLYILLLNLAGQLSTFSNMGIRTSEFQSYDHRHLNEVFNQVISDINQMLNVQKTLERRDVVIPLRKQADTLYVGQLSPSQISSQFFLSVTGDIPEKKIITELPKNIKISAYEEIFAVHQAGIQGVTLEYTARPPVGVLVNEKAHYFKINKEGRFWEKITAKNNIAFFIASEFKTLQMELVLLLPGD
ncbi:MAG TPA: type VI secretion system baseplate subunit TssK [Ignavibacteriaceae bacterium]|jgi:type VI secretion system protein ImpJ|nr:type VI secretion system baseplate subunit TssK [Ignavibacteriaceae bacterium]